MASVAFDLPRPSDQRAFSFRAPEFPPSFSGRLISLVWGLDLVLEPVGAEAIELVIAPAAQELSLKRPRVDRDRGTGGRTKSVPAVWPVKARENPFRSECVDALPYRAPEFDWDGLEARWGDSLLERVAARRPQPL